MARKDFDDILVLLKSGKWNLLYFIGVSSMSFWLPCVIIAGAFVAPKVNHTCLVDSSADVIHVGECSYTTIDESGENRTHKCSSWDYHLNHSSNYLTTEFNLVCDRAFLRPTYQTAYMVGNIVGSPINGVLSDRFGRKSVILVTTILGLTSVLVSFAFGDIALIIAARFVTGFCFHSMLLSSYALFIEVCEPKHRAKAGIYYTLPWAFGTIWWGCLGYLIRDWRWLQSASLVPSLILLVCLCFYDESPRWLIINGKHERALEAIKKAARWNKSPPLPPDQELFEAMAEIEKSSLEMKKGKSRERAEGGNLVALKVKSVLERVVVLFRTPAMRKITLLMYLSFFVAGLVYYGMSLNADNFRLDPYVYMVVIGATMIPAYTFTGPVIERFGRVKPTVATYLVCGLSSFVLAALSIVGKQQDFLWLTILMVVFGYTCIAAAFQIVFLVAPEIFPTEVRMQGFGTSSFLSSVGGGIAPFITDLMGGIQPWIPTVFFGLLSVVLALGSAFIPETQGKHLPETIEELENRTKGSARGI